RDVLGKGIPASPGAATGRIVFSATEAQAHAARDEPCILVRRETSPEDIRGMHAAAAVLTEKGGITSHAAVIGRGMGLPCVVGASSVKFNMRRKQLVAADGRILSAGDLITLDGSSGEIIAGEVAMQEAALDENFTRLMSWAEDAADIAVRANADTPADARTARNFNAYGIGLCRTEHMFFEQGRLTVMREMIFAETGEDRRAVLERLLPIQREDFLQMLRIMQGLPVCIRLFDPPLHEFLPVDKAGQRELADALDLPLSHVTRRVEAMSEYNPMLGMRGVRLGVAVPEIYEMQARAIFEATILASQQGDPVVPEIMIPLVTTKREVELV
ncbi:MAG: putative PEP-binding protein, partial [Pseudomonadota bacterium]